MSSFLIGPGAAATFDGIEYAADEVGVIAIPDALDLVATNIHGLTRYVEAPAAAAAEPPAAEVPVARGPGRPRKADAVLVAEEVPASEVPAE